MVTAIPLLIPIIATLIQEATKMIAAGRASGALSEAQANAYLDDLTLRVHAAVRNVANLEVRDV